MITTTTESGFLSGAFGADPAPSVPAAPVADADVTVSLDMTGEQFVYHIRDLMWTLTWMRGVFTKWLEQYTLGDLDVFEIMNGINARWSGGPITAIPSGQWPAGFAVGADGLREIIELIDYRLADTADVFGDDWQTVFLDHKNVLALGYRLGKRPPAWIKEWYVATAKVVDLGYNLYEMDTSYRLAVGSEHGFWDRMIAAANQTVEWFGKMIKQVGEWIESVGSAVLEAVGGIGGAITSGALSAIWKTVKPLILPAILIGGGTLGGLYLWNRHRAKFLGEPCPPGEVRDLVRGRCVPVPLPPQAAAAAGMMGGWLPSRRATWG